MPTWRWWEEAEADSPDRNMAVDTALLAEVREDGEARPVVRVYRWDRPCVSLGRLQDEAAVRVVYPDRPLVRRPTGGRAVRHGADLTVSVAARLDDLPLPRSAGTLASYRLIVGGVVEALCAVDIAAGFGEERDRPLRHEVNCFDRATRCDVVCRRTGRKIVGCAQRREGHALLLQMSFPLIGASDQAAFLAALRRSLTTRLGVSAWLYVTG